MASENASAQPIVAADAVALSSVETAVIGSAGASAPAETDLPPPALPDAMERDTSKGSSSNVSMAPVDDSPTPASPVPAMPPSPPGQLSAKDRQAAALAQMEASKKRKREKRATKKAQKRAAEWAESGGADWSDWGATTWNQDQEPAAAAAIEDADNSSTDASLGAASMASTCPSPTKASTTDAITPTNSAASSAATAVSPSPVATDTPQTVLDGLANDLFKACTGNDEVAIDELLKMRMGTPPYKAAIPFDISKQSSGDIDGLGKSATPLHIAAQRGHVAIVRKLVEHGANYTLLTSRGYAAWMVASRSGNTEIVRYLNSISRKMQTPAGFVGNRFHSSTSNASPSASSAAGSGSSFSDSFGTGAAFVSAGYSGGAIGSIAKRRKLEKAVEEAMDR